MNKEKEIEIISLAAKLRNRSLKLALDAGKNGSHVGGGLSMVEIFATLYGCIISINKDKPKEINRDRVIVSKGHCVLSYYSVLNEFGFVTDEDLLGFETNGAMLHGHATRDVERGIEFSGGSLGLGLSYAIGVALAGKLNNLTYRVYAIIGDGECNEGIVWEAFMSASHFKLDNITVIIDHNKLQYDGDVDTIMNMGSLKTKLEAFGFHTIEVDGHNVSQLFDAFNNKVSNKPHAIVANTVKGKGISFMENKKEWHHSILSKEQYDCAIAEQLIKL